jgi:hypothetical protein
VKIPSPMNKLLMMFLMIAFLTRPPTELKGRGLNAPCLRHR